MQGDGRKSNQCAPQRPKSFHARRRWLKSKLHLMHSSALVSLFFLKLLSSSGRSDKIPCAKSSSILRWISCLLEVGRCSLYQVLVFSAHSLNDKNPSSRFEGVKSKLARCDARSLLIQSRNSSWYDLEKLPHFR